MEGLSLNSISITSKHRTAGGCRRLPEQIKKNYICCQSGGNAIKNCGLSSSSVLTERSSSSLINADHSPPPPLIDSTSGGLVLSPNGNNSSQAEINQVKDLVGFNGTSSNSLAESPEIGIGITKFLGGKTFFITGATGFLGKGEVNVSHYMTFFIVKLHFVFKIFHDSC